MNSNQERLFIKQIKIINCGRFYGEHTIDLSASAEKNITIIVGDSGRGKSTIHDLIYWCLYGKFKIRETIDPTGKAEKEDNKDYGLINTDKLEDLKINEEVVASVSLSLHDQNDEKFFLERSLTAIHKRDSDVRVNEPLNDSMVRKGTTFEMGSKLIMKDDTGNKEIIKDSLLIQARIKNIFPENLTDFFLFDGENLEKFRKVSTSTGYIKNGIEKISGLPLLDKLTKSAEDCAEAIRLATGDEWDSSGLSATYEKAKDDVTELDDTIKNEEKELGKKKGLLEEYARIIERQEGGKEILDDIKKEQNKKNGMVKDLADNKIEIKDFLFDHFPNLLIQETVEKCEEIFERLENEDKIPPAVSRGAIDKILHSDPLTCICGTEFTEGDNFWEKLNGIRNTIIADDTSKWIGAGREQIARIIDSSRKDKRKIDFDELIQTRKETRDSIEKLDTTIEELETKQSLVKTEDDQDVGLLKTGLWNEILTLQSTISNNKFELEDLIVKRDKHKSDLDKLRIREGQYEDENKKIAILETVHKFTKERRQIIADDLRILAENSTSKYFMESAPEAQSFDRVNISEKYEITARDSRDLIAPLSMGQAHVLGLSYVAGCRSVTNLDTFLIIDSPLHNISGKYRNQISEALAEYLPGVQLVLLVTDSEYLYGKTSKTGTAKAVKDILRPTNKIWKEWQINHVELDECNSLGNKIESRKIEELDDV